MARTAVNVTGDLVACRLLSGIETETAAPEVQKPQAQEPQEAAP